MSFSFYKILEILSANKIRLPVLSTHFFKRDRLKSSFVATNDIIESKTHHLFDTVSECVEYIHSKVFVPSKDKTICSIHDKRKRHAVCEKNMGELPSNVYFVQEEPPCLLYTSDAADE